VAKARETVKTAAPAKKAGGKGKPASKHIAPAKNQALVDFVDLDWHEVAKGAREKGLSRAGITLRLLEITAEFEEVGFCLKGHAGVVLEGDMELELPGGKALFKEAQGFILLPGGEDRHRAKALTSEVLLLLVDYT